MSLRLRVSHCFSNRTQGRVYRLQGYRQKRATNMYDTHAHILFSPGIHYREIDGPKIGWIIGSPHNSCPRARAPRQTPREAPEGD